MHQLGVEGMLEDQVGLGKPLLHVALAPGDVGEHVVDVRLWLRQALVTGHLRMQRRRIRLHGLVGVENGRQLLVFDVDEQQRLLGCRLRFCRYRRHLFSDETHHAPGQHWHVPKPPAHQRIRQVGGGDDRVDARNGPCFRRVDADDAGVGERRAQHLAPQHSGQRDVSGVDRLAGDLVRPLAANDGLADGARCRGHFSPQCPCRRLPQS